MTDELVHQLALELIPGIGQKGAQQLISYCGSAKQVFQSSKNNLLKIPGIGVKMVAAILSANTTRKSEQIINSCEMAKINIHHFTDVNYPDNLRHIHDPPSFLFSKGSAFLNPEKSIAIVGTRNATSYGKLITEKIVEELSDFNITTISGLAYGIDIQAHKTSLKYKIPTIAILAGGVDCIYPAIHRKYVNEMLDNGAIVSESIPGTKPDAHLFPVRNRIIAGMADATIVVEAAERGGALITAQLADSYHRCVFAVPGNLNQPFSKGTNHLIASQKALIYTGINDLIDQLGWSHETETTKIPPPELSGDESIVFDVLLQNKEAMAIDVISRKTDLLVNNVAAILLTLEFKNLVKSYPGKKFAVN